MKKEEIVRLLRKRYEYSSSSDKSERTQADADIKFGINHEDSQWPKAIKAARENKMPPRPCLVMNKIPEKIDQVDGEFRQLRPSIKVRPVDSNADVKVAEIISGLIRHIEYNSSAKDVYSSSNTSTLYCGRGAWRIDIEDSVDDPFIRDIVINRIPNVFTVYWDPEAKKLTKSDANWWIITEQISEEEYKVEYPNNPISDFDSDETHPVWASENKVRIAEYWWKEKEEKKVYRVNRNGTVITVWETQVGDEVIEEKKVNHTKVRWCKSNGIEVLDGPHDDWPSKYIPIVLQVGKEVNIDGVPQTRGMVRFAKTPQTMYNYWATSEAESIALAPKSPYLATPGMIGNHQAQWDVANAENFFVLLYDPDPLMPGMYPKRELPPQLSGAMLSAKAAMEHDIMAAMGIYQASLGDAGQEKSGKAIMARQKQGNIGSYTFTDHFMSALVYSFNILVDLIPSVFDTERIIRIMGEDGSEKSVPINAREEFAMQQEVPEALLSKRPEVTQYINDLSVGKYDIVVTVGPSYATQRLEALDMLLDLSEKVPQFGVSAIDLIVKNIDIPGSDELIKRAKKLIPPGLRELEEGEQPPQDKEPDAGTMIKMKEVEIKFMEQMRKNFETEVKSLLIVAKAEAAEVGQQIGMYRAQIEEIKANVNKSPSMNSNTPPSVAQG